jgi:tRNA U34 5-carboxymethylaminomethyl modifying GTPase MnmE/TrmE
MTDGSFSETQPTDSIEAEVDIVTAAEHLRYAADALVSITGKGESGDVEDVLGVVFEKFCVGK